MLKCKVFSATKSADRETLGERVTTFLRSSAVTEVESADVRQSSDSEFHCYTIILWYR